MERLYRITPLEKKSVEYFVDVYETMPDGRIRGFDVTETWRWGYGFREMDNEVSQFEADPERMHGAHCDPQVGWGCELEDLVHVQVNFTDGFTEEEKAEIEVRLRWEKEDDEGRCGTGWIYDGNHHWQIEEDHVRILPPFRIDIVDADGYGETAVLESDVQPAA